MAVLSSSRELAAVRPAAGRAGLRSPVVLLALACAAALCAAVAIHPDDATHGPVVCPFRLATGLPCPGCGMTRAWVFLAHDRVGDAVSANPFALLAFPAAGTLVVLVAITLVRRRPPPDLSRIARSWLTKALVGAWLVFGVVRIGAVATGHASI